MASGAVLEKSKGNRGLYGQKLKRVLWGLKKDRYLYIMLIPVIAFFILFRYVPMYGVTIAFKDFQPMKGILDSPWTSEFGLKYFKMFFNSFYFVRILKNTVLISVYGLLWSFPIPILFALLLNELRLGLFKRVVQTVSYLPHFISTVIVVGILMMLLSPNNGVVNHALAQFGYTPINFMSEPKWFRTIYISSGIWQEFGWSSIIYIATISSIDPQQYEAAIIDGATRFKRVLYVTLPCMLPTITILLVLSISSIMGVGFEKIFAMQTPVTYEVSDVISTYVYRQGIREMNYSYAAAVDLFNSLVNFVLLFGSNYMNKKLTGTSLF